MLPPQFAVWSNHRDSRKDAKKTPAPSCAPDTMRARARIVAICIKGKPLGVSLAISLEHACKMGLNMEWPERNIRLKGLFTSPEASRDRLTAVRAVSAAAAPRSAISHAIPRRRWGRAERASGDPLWRFARGAARTRNGVTDAGDRGAPGHGAYTVTGRRPCVSLYSSKFVAPVARAARGVYLSSCAIPITRAARYTAATSARVRRAPPAGRSACAPPPRCVAVCARARRQTGGAAPDGLDPRVLG